MSASGGWEPLDERVKEPLPRDPMSPFIVSPFTRLARTHLLMTGGDAAITVALAGSLFFDIDPKAARWRVGAYLLFSLAPFIIVAPFVGPAVDRAPGGRRLVILVLALLRVVVTTMMAFTLDSLLLFPLAFATLVLQKSYQVSRAALVPSVVKDDAELVEANAKLGLLAALSGVVFALPALVFSKFSPPFTMFFGAALFAAAMVAAIRLPRDVVAAEQADARERAELRDPSIVLAASAMGVLRACVGFLTFQLAFWFRNTGTATIWFGLVLATSVVCTAAGNAVGGVVRKALREEWMLVAGLAVAAAAGLFAAVFTSHATAALVAGAVGLGASIGRLAFDSIVQRDAPDANRGRAFARFETRFQLGWVAAAAVPVIIPIPGPVGFALLALMAAFAAVSYVVGSRRLKAGRGLPEPIGRRVWRRVRDARAARAHDDDVPDGSPLPPPTVDASAAPPAAADDAGAPLPPPPAAAEPPAPVREEAPRLDPLVPSPSRHLPPPAPHAPGARPDGSPPPATGR